MQFKKNQNYETMTWETMEDEVTMINPEETGSNRRESEVLGLPELHWTQGTYSETPILYERMSVWHC